MKQRGIAAAMDEESPAPETIEIRGAEAIMRCLLDQGVDTIFGYPGGAIMPAYDALYDYRDRIRHVLVRHEQGATHAAEGHARITGKAGVCIATSGPGATNLVTGIADALMDSIPLVCITGQVGSHFLGTDAFQETDVIGITMPITKWNYQVTAAAEIPEAIAKAFMIAESGRPGPVVVDITKNAQVETCRYVPAKHVRPHILRIPKHTIDEISAAATLINEAKKPYILAGHGILISGAHQELIALAERGGIPVALTLQGLSAMPSDHPLYMGMLGMHGNYGPNILTNEADVILAVGMRFDDRVTGNLGKYARQAKVIHIDIDRAEIDKNVKSFLGIPADAKAALQALLPLIEERSHPEWIKEFRDCHETEHQRVMLPEIHPDSNEMRMAEVVHEISEQSHGEAVIVTDVGQHQMITARYYRFRNPGSFISSGGLGTMGFGIPAALGASLALRRQLRPPQVIVIVGDGGFQMTCQELGSIAQEKAPVKIVVLNNNYLGMVRQWQEMFFDGRYSFVGLKNPDFTALGAAFGISGERVSRREDLAGAIRRMIEAEGAYLLAIDVERENKVFPMIPAGAGVAEIRLE